MGKKASNISLSNVDRPYLETQTRARTIQAKIVNCTRSLLLKAGEAIPLIKDSHNSKDYIEFPKKLDESIPKQKRYVFKQINREAYRIWSKIMSQ